MRENRYQRQVILRLRRDFPGCVVLKNDPDYIQGIPDLTVLFPNGGWAVLETKASINASNRPNQEYYIDQMNSMSFAAFVYPENEEDVFSGLQQTFSHSSKSRGSRNT